MKAVLVLASVGLIFALDVAASVRVLRSELITQSQKIAWLGLAWLLPLLGAILALQVSGERARPAPIAGSYGMGGGVADGGPFSDSHCGGGHGGDGGGGDGGGH